MPETKGKQLEDIEAYFQDLAKGKDPDPDPDAESFEPSARQEERGPLGVP